MAWGILSDSLSEVDAVYSAIFVSLVSFGTIVILNLITAMCVGFESDSRSFEVAAGHDAAIARRAGLNEKVFESIRSFFRQADTNSSGDISIDEFVELVKEPRALALFDHLDLDATDPHGLFDLLDSSRSGVLQEDDFVFGCLRLRGGAKKSSVANVQVKLDMLSRSLQEIKDATLLTKSALASSEQFAAHISKAEKLREMAQESEKNQYLHRSSVCPKKSSFSVMFAGGKQSIPETDRRAMTLKELLGVHNVIAEQCLQEAWVDVISGRPQFPEEVTLYGLNCYHLSPSTAVEFVLLEGLKCSGAMAEQQVVQSNPASLSHYSCPMAVGEVMKDFEDGSTLKVKLLRGRFQSSAVAAGACVSIEGRSCGVPTAVTSPNSVSYKELVSSEEQVPLWYTSHWWGAPVFNFVSCCETHAKLRGLTNPSYWVCAYANRQHDLDAEINVSHLQETSFFKAMQHAEGVLLILCETAMPFQRMWCSFELYVTITANKKVDGTASKMLDVATVSEGKAMIIVEDLLPDEPRRAKMVRQKCFPLLHLEKGMIDSLEQGACYLESDRNKILDFMAADCQEPGSWTDKRRLALKYANEALNAYFALASWPYGIRQNRVHDFEAEDGVRRIDLPSILRVDSKRDSLKFSLAHFHEVTNADIELIAQGLPPNLKFLELDLEGCNLITSLHAFKGCLPRGLLSFRLSVRSCNLMHDHAIITLAKELNGLQCLTEFVLDCGYCKELTYGALAALAKNMPESVKSQQCQVLFRGTEVDKDFKTLEDLIKTGKTSRWANRADLT